MAASTRRLAPALHHQHTGQLPGLVSREYRVLFTQLMPVFESEYGLPQTECGELITAMVAEFDQLRSTIGIKIALGQRPA